MNDEQKTKAIECIRSLKRSHISAQTLTSKLDFSLKVSGEVIQQLIDAGVLGPRVHAGYPVLNCEPTTSESAEVSSGPMETTIQPPASGNPSSEGCTEKPPKQWEAGGGGSSGAGTESAPAAPQPLLVPLKRITRDPSIQPRAGVDREVVIAYADAMGEGAEFPAVIVYDDGSGQLILADGWHRVAAAEELGRTEITATVVKGSKREATLRAIQENVSLNQPLTNEEKRNAALRLLADEEWGQWSDAEIARRCGFSAAHVGRLRKAHSNNVSVTRKCRGKNGKVRVMKTSKMGKKRRTPAPNSVPVQSGASATGPVANQSHVSADCEAATTEHSLSLITKGATSFLAVPEATRMASLQALEPQLLFELRDLLTKVFNQLPPEMRAAA